MNRYFLAAILAVASIVPTQWAVIKFRADGSTTNRTLANKLADTVSVKDFGATGDGTTDDTTSIQAALNSSYAHIIFPDGTYRTTTRLTQTPGTTVRFSGSAYLYPDASSWSNSYVYEIYDNWNNPSGDFLNGQYLRGNRTAVYGLRIYSAAPVAATCLYGSNGIGIIINDFHSWGCTAGGIYIAAGASWRINDAQVVAPYGATVGASATASAYGVKINTSDVILRGFESEGYPVGMYLTSTATTTQISSAHVWGQPAAQINPAWVATTAYIVGQIVSNGGKSYRCITAGTSASAGGPSGTTTSITDGTVIWTWIASSTGAGKMMNWGLYADGGGASAGGTNRCIDCVLDTPERVVAANPASAANGGIGYYSEQWHNHCIGCQVLGSANLSKAFMIQDAQDNNLIGCVAAFDAAKFEVAGYVVFGGTATGYNNNVVGGSFNRDGQFKSGPFWWSPTNGNMFWGSAAGSPGFDNTAGMAAYNSGAEFGVTREGEMISTNRPANDGQHWCLRKNTTTVGCFGTASATEVNVTAGLGLKSVTQANLGTPANGTIIYCSDCNTASACTAGGTGALASRQAAAWKCL